MKDPVFKDLGHKVVDYLGADFLQVIARFHQCYLFRNLDALDIFHDQHVAGGEFRVDPGDGDEPDIPVQLLEALDILGFHAEVQFQFQGLPELVHHFAGVPDAGLGQEPGQEGELLQQPQVVIDFDFDTRALDLDYHPGPIPQLPPVDLGDGCRGYGLGLELGKNPVQAIPQLGLDNFPDGLEAHGLYIVLELLKFLDILVGYDVGPGGEDLGDFNKGRPQFFQGLSQLGRAGNALF